LPSSYPCYCHAFPFRPWDRNNREVEDLDVRTLTDVPVGAIWGTRDNWVSLRSVRLYYGAFPQLELVKIKGAGHMPMETHVQQFIPPFLEFVTGL
ncbi:MAG: alpha/beta hydrolase, partial [Bacteroidota bacterium]